MIALGIETSCDDTSVAIIDDQRNIISNITISQKIHRDFGGVVPEVASRCHAQIIDKVITDSLQKSNLQFEDINLISATAGPGLIGGLIVGLMSAKTIASIYKNHLLQLII